jgi:hypothetical protein
MTMSNDIRDTQGSGALLAAALKGDRSAQRAIAGPNRVWVFKPQPDGSGFRAVLREGSKAGATRTPERYAETEASEFHLPFGANRVATTVTRLSGKPGVIRDLRVIFAAALNHCGNEYDAAHMLLSQIGLCAVNGDGAGRAAVLVDPGPITFGQTADGKQCDASDLRAGLQQERRAAVPKAEIDAA